MKFKRKKSSITKTGIIYCGLDGDKEDILVNGISRGLLSNIRIEAEDQLFKEYRIPVKPKPISELDEVQRRLYDVREQNESSKFVMCYDETKLDVKQNNISAQTLKNAIYYVIWHDW